MDKKNIIYLPVVMLCIVFAAEIFQTLLMFSYFPANDYASHMTYSYWLDVYGFEKPVPNWGANLVLFQTYAPLYGFMLSGIKIAAGSYQAAYPVSVFVLFALGFLALWFTGKKLGFDARERVACFLLVYASPMMLLDWMGGRAPEMLAWVFMFAFSGMMIYYKGKRPDRKFLLSSVLLSLVMLSHTFVAFFALVMMASLFISAGWKGRGIVLLSFAIMVAITSFWWIPFVQSIAHSSTGILVGYFSPSQLSYGSFFFPLLFLGSLFLYLREKKYDAKEVCFFLLPAIIAVLYMTKLVDFIPYVSRIYPGIYQVFLLFLSVFLILNLLKSPAYRKLALAAAVLLGIAFSFVAFTYYPTMNRDIFNKNTNRIFNNDIAGFMPNVTGSFVIVATPTNYSQDFEELYCYSAMYYNLTTPFSWFTSIVGNGDDGLDGLLPSIANRDCGNFTAAVKELGVSTLLAYPIECDWLVSCGLKYETKDSRGACLFRVSGTA